MAANAGHVGAFYLSQQYALLCNANSDIVTISDPSGGELDFGDGQAMSVEMWVNIASTGDGGLIEKIAAAAGWKLEVAANKAVFTLDDNVSTAAVTSTDSVNTATWTHIVGTWDGTDTASIYVNADDNADTATQVLGTLANAEDIILGDATNGNTRYIAVTRIYNSELSAADVDKLFAGNFPGDLKENLVGWWGTWSGAGTTLKDSTGTNDGVIATAAMWDTTTYDTATTEAVDTGDGSTTDYSLDNENVDWQNLTVTVAGTGKTIGTDFNIDPKGSISFHTAPATGEAIVATYRYWSMTLEAGGFFSWSIDRTCNIYDKTDFMNNGSREFDSELKMWAATAERHWINPQMNNAVGSQFIIKFFYNDDNVEYYNGWGLITGLNPSVAVDALTDETISIQGLWDFGIESS